MRKRQKFVLTAVLLSLGLWWSQTTSLDIRFWAILGLMMVTWVLSVWSLYEGLSGVEWLIVPMPTSLFSLAVGMFYILLPSHWLAKTIIYVLFAVGQYALLLSANIFSVAKIRTIALLRAATAVNFVMTLLTAYLLYNTILSLRMGIGVIAPLVFISSLALLLPALWSVDLSQRLNSAIISFALVCAILMAGLSVTITLWPISISVSSIFLTAVLYVYVGVTQHHFTQRLFKNTVLEYITVAAVALITVLVTSFF
jgi:hypothetical protein